MPMMLVVGRLRQEDLELHTSLVAKPDPVSSRKIKLSQQTTNKPGSSPPGSRFFFVLSPLAQSAIF